MLAVQCNNKNRWFLKPSYDIFFKIPNIPLCCFLPLLFLLSISTLQQIITETVIKMSDRKRVITSRCKKAKNNNNYTPLTKLLARQARPGTTHDGSGTKAEIYSIHISNKSASIKTKDIPIDSSKLLCFSFILFYSKSC